MILFKFDTSAYICINDGDLEWKVIADYLKLLPRCDYSVGYITTYLNCNMASSFTIRNDSDVTSMILKLGKLKCYKQYKIYED